MVPANFFMVSFELNKQRREKATFFFFDGMIASFENLRVKIMPMCFATDTFDSRKILTFYYGVDSKIYIATQNICFVSTSLKKATLLARGRSSRTWICFQIPKYVFFHLFLRFFAAKIRWFCLLLQIRCLLGGPPKPVCF